MYSVRIDGPEAVAAMLPQARELAEAMRAAGRPSRSRCAALLKTKKASAGPEKIVAWYFARVFRPAGILDRLPRRQGSIRVVSDACAVALVPQPDPLKVLKSLVLDAVSSPLTKRQYEIALDRAAEGRGLGPDRLRPPT